MSRLRLAVTACALLVVSGAGSAVRAENPDWASIAATFADQFKVRSGVSFKQKRSAVNALAKCEDGRGVDLLIGTVDDQQRFAGKLRKEWDTGEKEFQEKVKRMDAQMAPKLREAQARGDDTISLTPEEAEWFGTETKPSKMKEQKERLATAYAAVLEEEGLVDTMLRAVSRILNTLEGEELQRATARATDAATAAKSERRLAFTRAFGYAKGDGVTTYLERQTKDPNVEVVQTALEAIGRQNTERGTKILISRLDDPRWQARASAITGLAFTRNPATVGDVMDALLARAKKEEGVLQRNFFVAMARIVQEALPGTIEAWEGWWKANRVEFQRKVEARIENGLPIEDDPQDVIVQTEAGSSSFYGITTTSKHIIYVVDVSGSMAWDSKDPEKKVVEPGGRQRIEVAREELKKALQGLSAAHGDERGEASFNIVIFSSEVQVYKPGKMIDATKTAKEAAWKWVEEKVVAEGATNIYDAIEQAFNIISATSDAKNLTRGADTIFLMTDGEPNRGKFVEPELIVSEVKRMNATRKITLHTIGLGVGSKGGPSGDFLQKLAAANGGQFIAR